MIEKLQDKKEHSVCALSGSTTELKVVILFISQPAVNAFKFARTFILHYLYVSDQIFFYNAITSIAKEVVIKEIAMLKKSKIFSSGGYDG